MLTQRCVCFVFVVCRFGSNSRTRNDLISSHRDIEILQQQVMELRNDHFKEKEILRDQIQLLHDKLEFQTKQLQWKQQEHDLLHNQNRILQHSLDQALEHQRFLEKQRAARDDDGATGFSASQFATIDLANISTTQQNIAVVQLQLQAIQSQNAGLTKEFILKENYLQLKEQQYRAMQNRMEELERAVVSWKDRFLEIQAAQGNDMDLPLPAMNSLAPPPSYLEPPGFASSKENSPWVPWTGARGMTGAEVSTAKAFALYEQLNTTERDKIKRFVSFSQSKDGEVVVKKLSDNLEVTELFDEASEELKFFVCYHLVPLFADCLECFSKTYMKSTSDLKLVMSKRCTSNIKERNSSGAPASSGSDLSAGSHKSGGTRRSDSGLKGSEDDDEEHMFDMVDCENPRKFQTHGARELHPSKAVYTSKPCTVASRKRANTNFITGSDSGRGSFNSSITDVGSLGFFGDEQSSSGSGSRSSGSGASLSGGGSTEGRNAGGIKKFMGSMMGNVKDRLNRHKTSSQEESVCSGCGRSPLVGIKWRCRTCFKDGDGEVLELCEKCYGQGVHGKERKHKELTSRIVDIVVSKCPRLSGEDELTQLLFDGVCKENPKKFSFFLTWIADVISCRNTKELRARALEVSQISPEVRMEFVRRLTDLLRFRNDIELITEWEPVRNRTEDAGELDTLRIWVKDAGDPGSGP